MKRRTCLSLPCAALSPLAGCAWWTREAVVPMPVLRRNAQLDRQAPVLAVMLPGIHSGPKEFIDNGFVAGLREKRFAVDAVMADSHRGYAENGTLLERLHDDVLAPARRAGYRRLWLVGISLGGMASLGLLMRHAGDIEGVVAIAPYLGPPELVRRITEAGGAQAFAASTHNERNFGTELWSLLGLASPAVRHKIHLYTGAADRFIDAQRLLAAHLDAEQVLELPGDHDWPVWKALWARWLARAPWPREQA